MTPPPGRPLDWAGTDRFVPWILAPMVFLAVLALAFGIAASSLIDRYSASLTGTWTVQVPAAADTGATAGRVEAALAALDAQPGVAAATPVDADDVARLLEPWLGADLPADLSLPVLIDLRLDRSAPPDRAAVQAALDAAVPGAMVDDHADWLAGIEGAIGTARLVAALCLVLIGIAAVATVVVVTRSGLAIHGHAIELLHVMGASDGYVARQFQRRAFDLAVRGGAVGILAGLATLAALQLTAMGLGGGLLPDLPLGPADWATLLLVPALASVLATATARLTVLHSLARLP